MQADKKQPGRYRRVNQVPRLVIEIILTVVVAEFIVMLILPFFPAEMGGKFGAIIDAVLLSALSGPVILWRSLVALDKFEISALPGRIGDLDSIEEGATEGCGVSTSTSSRPIKYLIGALVLGTLAFSILLNSMLERIRVGGPIYASILEQKEFIADILPPPEYIVESYLVALQLVNKNHRNEIEDLEAKLNKLYEEFEERQLYWSERLGNDRIRHLLIVESSPPARDFFNIAIQKLLPLVKAGDYETATEIISSEADRCYLKHRAAIDELTELSREKALVIEKKAVMEMRSGFVPLVVVIGLFALGTLVAILLWMIARYFYVSTAHLENRVALRTLQVEQANREIRELLDSVKQGFLRVDCEGCIGNKHSKAVIDLLGDIPESRKFVDLLARHHPSTAEWFEFGLGDVFAGIMPLELTLDQLPKQIKSKARYLSLQYVPVFDGGELTHIVVVVSDITADVEREKLEVENREFLAIIDRIASDQVAFLEFFTEAETLINRLRERPTEVNDDIQRDLHTLKGNASVFGLARVANACHAIEDHIAENNEFPSSNLWTELFQSWASTRGNLRRLMTDTEVKVTLGDEEYSSVLLAILTNVPKSQLATRVASWRLEPTRRRIENLAEQAISLGIKLGKGVLNIEIEDNGLRTDPKHWSKFWSSIVHVIRNSVDHGMETLDERLKQNKLGLGTITLSTSIEANHYVIAVKDDGRGIDWECVRTAAQRKGLPCESDQDLREALFHIGVSTSDSVTKTSGRGVGMAAVRESCRSLGGIIEIHSQLRKGTEFRFVFPVESMAHEMYMLLAKHGIENPSAITCNALAN